MAAACFVTAICLAGTAQDVEEMPERAERIEYMLENQDELTVSERYELKEEALDYNEDAVKYNKNPRFYGLDKEIKTYEFEN